MQRERGATLADDALNEIAALLAAMRRAAHPSRISNRTTPSPSFLNRLPDPLHDNRRILGEVERHGPVKPLRSGDQYPHATSKGIGRYPGFVWSGQMAAGGYNGLLD